MTFADLEHGCIEGTAVILITMCIQQTGIARWHKNGFLEQAFVKQVQTSGSADASSPACMQQATEMQTSCAWCSNILVMHFGSAWLTFTSCGRLCWLGLNHSDVTLPKDRLTDFDCYVRDLTQLQHIALMYGNQGHHGWQVATT